MGRIRQLPPHVVNQIAAGEVVERPASVVKELVENAVDAGATRVEVRLVEGGKARIEVRDDGCGMDADDLAAAFLPHATSKLADVGDLEHIASLGFRGEALASIGSVARATITSRPAGADAGAVVEDREGAVTCVRPAAAAPGTVIVVEGLFAGVPARRKFLRSAATELGHAVETMERFALAFPDVVFVLEHEGRTLVDTAAGEGRRARIGRFHGDDLARALLEARSAPGAAVEVEAWLSPPGLSRADARLQQVFVNGRFVRDRTSLHALREAYRDLVPPGDRQPIVFLFVTCDPARVDVNVHPQKAEVRWRDASAVHESVRRTLRAALEGARPGVPVAPWERPGVPRSTVEAAEWAFTQGAGLPVGAPSAPRGPAWPGGGDHLPDATADVAVSRAASPAGGASAVASAGPGATAVSGRERLRPVGQVLGTYLVLEGEDGLVLVDQHALHERVLFDQISDRLRDGALEVQHLLVPAVVSLSRAEVARVEEERGTFERLGWVVEPFGEGAVAVRACPAVLRRPDPEGMLREVLAVLDTGRRSGLDRAALLSAVVDRMACRGAVMAGDALHPDEVLALLAQAEALNHAHSCPHGRPTRLVMSRRDLERYFHR
ncbi:MAG: DNA mismatch repair endonuclease MutL [Planctomycetes bacterium]|nr:DNA mismatch repair endonuclease MutL [Planctomycetota bacterium]